MLLDRISKLHIFFLFEFIMNVLDGCVLHYFVIIMIYSMCNVCMCLLIFLDVIAQQAGYYFSTRFRNRHEYFA